MAILKADGGTYLLFFTSAWKGQDLLQYVPLYNTKYTPKDPDVHVVIRYNKPKRKVHQATLGLPQEEQPPRPQEQAEGQCFWYQPYSCL
jgi:hypothetical protein